MAPLARNRELEAAIVANPDDRDNYVVYCDWLEAQGDPRAELMRWQLKQEQKSASWLRRVIGNVFARVEPLLIGDLGRRAAQGGPVTPHGPLWWRSGFVHGVRLEHTVPDLPKLLADLLAHPSCFALREIEIVPPHRDYRPRLDDVRPAIAAMVARAPATVRVVRLAAQCDAPDAAKLARLPCLEELRLGASSGSALAGETVRAIGGAPWRALRTLQLGIGTGASTTDFAPLLARTDLSLDELMLEGAHGGHGLVHALLTSPLATRIARLSIMFELGEADYKLLVANRAHFAATREFWVRDRTWSERLALRPDVNA